MPDLDSAYQYCRDITVNHYENFPVASVLLPARIRRHVYPIYAFARHADDLADEHHDRNALLEWRQQLHDLEHHPPKHPIFMALKDTIQKFEIPTTLFDQLISAFLQDLDKNRYQDLNELLDYCQRSANPVGRLILLLHGYKDDKLFQFSDHICTALQLTNFWQDVSIDIQKDRVYVPKTHWSAVAMDQQIAQEAKTPQALRSSLADLVNETDLMFQKGLPLLQAISGRLRWELKMTVLGGLNILKKIKENQYFVLENRPKLNKLDWFRILIQLFKPIGIHAK